MNFIYRLLKFNRNRGKKKKASLEEHEIQEVQLNVVTIKKFYYITFSLLYIHLKELDNQIHITWWNGNILYGNHNMFTLLYFNGRNDFNISFPLTTDSAESMEENKTNKKNQNNNKTTKQKMLFWLSSIYPLLHFFPLHTYHKRKNVCSRTEPPIISPAALRWYILWTVQIPQHRIREIFFSRNWKRGQVQIDTKFVDHNRSY